MVPRLLLLLAISAACVGPKRQERARSRADLGTAYLREGNTPGAVEVLQEATRLDARNWNAWNKLGLAYMARGADDRAERAFRRALRLVPGKAEVHNNYGLLLLNTGRLDEAIAHFETATGDITYRSPSMVLNNLGFALFQAGRYDEAKRALDQAIHRAPNICQARFNRGLVQHASARPEAAIEDFEAAIQLCGDTATGSYYHAARAMLETGDRAGACDYLRHAATVAARTELGDAAADLQAKECR